MKKSVVTLYSFLVIVALIILAGWLGFTYYTGSTGSLTEFQESVPALNRQVSDLLKETDDPGSDQFKSSMEDFLQSRPEIKGLLIYSADNRLYYTRLESKNNRLMENLQKNEMYLLEKISEGTYKPPFGMGHETLPLTSIRGTALYVSYIHEVFSPIRIYELLLYALYLIAGLFILTLVLLGILSIKERNQGVEKNDDFFEPPTPEPSQVGEDLPSPPLPSDISDDLNFSDDIAADTADVDLSGFDDNDEVSFDFDLSQNPLESISDNDLEDMDFALPEEEQTDELESMDFDLPMEDLSESDELESMDFDLPEEETADAEELESMDFDLPEEETADAEELESMDFDLPEVETADTEELESMDFDLSEEETAGTDELESMDFDLPEAEAADEDELESMDFDLPTEDLSEPDELDIMDMDLRDEEAAGPEELESMDLDLDEIDLDAPSEELDSLDDGGDLFDDLEELAESDEADEELVDLPDESEDLLEDLSDEDILGNTVLDIEDAEVIEDLPELEDFMADDDLLEDLDASEELESAEVIDDVEDEVEEENPGLYSPRSDVCWENFLDDRLAQELDRAASENEDLSFIYMRDNSVQNDDDYKAFSEVLTKDFPYRDMIFEWGDQGFAMVLTNSDLVETLEKLDVFINELPEQDIRIGATSRNGRLLDKDQLIGEASAAIQRTTADNRIVGFRADPERYRESIGEE